MYAPRAVRRGLWPRHRLDIAASDLARAAAFATRRRDGPGPAEALARAWAGEQGLVALSVRSAWAALLAAASWPAGDEVVFSAITHPDMATLARAHGLRVRSLAVERDSLALRPERLEPALGRATRAVVVAHLLGARSSLAGVRALCDAHGALLVEDCAQCWRGPGDRGDALADISLFSFGLIKPATALGGALACVRDPALRVAMGRVQARWPLQPARVFRRRLALAAALTALARPRPYAALAAAARGARVDLETALPRGLRGFPAPDTRALLRAVRRRPCAAQVELLGERLRTYPPRRSERRRLIGERLARAANGRAIGQAAEERAHWLLGVALRDPGAAVRRLAEAGFDCSRRTSAIAAVVDDRRGAAPPAAERLLDELLFLPTYPELSDAAVERLANELTRLTAAEDA